jgi:hypothetical protein
MITLPTGMNLMDWADQVTMDLENKVIPRKLMNVDNWQEWANQFLELPDISKNNPPDPYSYSDWKEWADRFCEVIS